MSAIPSAALATPLDAERAELLVRLTEGLDDSALAWISGYLAGVAAERSKAPPVAVESAPRAETVVRATVLYGSQTGNGRRLAEQLARSIEAAGFAVRLVSAADYPVRSLIDERLLFLVVSTHGDGDPPDDARALVDHLLSRRAPRLERLGFAVFALGDSSYPQFCATGRAIDERLEALGAHRLLPRAEADLDVETQSGSWLEQALGIVRSEVGAPRRATVTTLRPASAAEPSRDQPVALDVLANQRITGRDSARDVRHFELALPEGRLRYEPGDSLGVWPENRAATAAQIALLLGARPELPVKVGARERALADWLIRDRELTRLARPFIEQHAARAASSELAARAADPVALRLLLRECQLIDLLREYPARWAPDELVAALRPLAPRLYSIASSRHAVGDEAHLTVAVLETTRGGERRSGAASAYLAERAQEGQQIRAFLEPNPRFRLPADPTRDIIMIGPGTGIAPFRGFLQERIAKGASGRQWLFFGARYFDSEFLYQAEWLEALKRGELTRLDVAFSRDQEQKVYVQQRLEERGRDVYDWLENGAAVYVCGDAERMAPDVEAALTSLIARHGGRSREMAGQYLQELACEKRYLRDVY
jgi:sulfite reductase (NADPH) flavoprotein alpha-component